MSGPLSQLGVSNLVVERKPALPAHPAAHVMRQRSMAILSLLGLDDSLRAVTPDLRIDYITWCATLAGKEIGKLDLRTEPAACVRARGYPWTNIPQNLLQPVLFANVSARRRATIAMGVECVGIENRPDYAVARLATPDSAAEYQVRASWVIAADGAGSPTRAMLGIPMEGPGPFAKFFMVHFAADLRALIEGRSGPLYFIQNPESPGVLIVHEPDRSSVFMTPVLGSANEEDQLRQRLEAALGISIPIEILSVRNWVAQEQVAARYREGRALLIGDAAHRFPPTGGLGLNTGIVEAHNLAWKLALVLNGKAGEALLNSYEAECRPAAQANAKDSLDNQMRLGLIGQALGHFADLKSLDARLETISDDERARLQLAVDSQRTHFTSNGTMPASARPSSVNKLGPVVSPYGVFRLAARTCDPWKEIASRMSSELGVEVMFERLDSDRESDLAGWMSRQQAIFERPDGIIEWSAETAGDDSGADLRRVMKDILVRDEALEK